MTQDELSAVEAMEAVDSEAIIALVGQLVGAAGLGEAKNMLPIR